VIFTAYNNNVSCIGGKRKMGDLRAAILEEASWGKTWNGADAKVTTDSACLDMFGRAGAMRASNLVDKQIMISKAYQEDPDIAVKLLFYVRDIRGGYGERDTFNDMIRHLASINPESVSKNIWAILEFGRAKDLYNLIGTPVEDAMWQFMKYQFELDLENMESGKSISLLAKWIATPDSNVEGTKELGKLTAKKLGYNFKTMSDYKKKLRKLRKYLDLPEAKMCAGEWDQIEYSKCASKFILKNRKAIMKHDSDRYSQYLENVNKGEATMHMGTTTPCDIIYQVRTNYTSDLETMWNSLEDVCKGNAMVICDTSGSMTSYDWSNRTKNSVKPIDVAFGLAMYFAQRNKGNLKNLMMNFSDRPMFIELNASTLRDNYLIADRAPVNYSSTDLEKAFMILLKTCVKGKLAKEDMPDAIVVVSDMQINCVSGIRDEKVTFYDEMKRRYAEAGYEIPQVVFWNVNASNPTFHASRSVNGVSMVSGFSPNVFKQVMENIGTTPYELMMAVVNSERYRDIVA